MRVSDFMGMAPSTQARNLKDNYAQLAENCDLYSGAIVPFRRSKPVGHVVDIYGNTKTTPSTTIHKAGDIWVGFDEHTFICPDPQNRAGYDSFLFVQDKQLYRSSPRQIISGNGPIKVGIERPTSPATGVILPGMGCPPVELATTCYDGTVSTPETTDDCDPNADVPTLVTIKFTYVSACNEESDLSDPSAYFDLKNSDAIALTDPNTDVPANAVSRRWYISMSSSKGEVAWFYVDTTPIDQPIFTYDKCLFEIGEMASTDNHNPPPACLDGVALVGNTVTVVWSGKDFWLSEPRLPHAYLDYNRNTLRFQIIGMYEVTDAVESPKAHYDLVAITKGYAYTVASVLPEDGIVIQELQKSKPGTLPQAVAVGGGSLFYTTDAGIYAITGGQVQEITPMFTEVEWADFEPHNQFLVYWDSRVWGFNSSRGFVITTSVEDERRRNTFVVITKKATAGYAAVNTRLMLLCDAVLNEWETGEGNMLARWRSKVYVQSGLWSPSRAKVCGSYERLPKGTALAITEYKAWQKVLRGTGTVSRFIARNTDYAKFAHLFSRAEQDTTFSISTEDTLVYHRVCPISGKDFTLPRKRMGVDWWFEVTTTDVIREVHVQTGAEDLTQEGGMA